MEDSEIKEGTFIVSLQWRPMGWPACDPLKMTALSKSAPAVEVFSGFIGPGDYLCGMLGTMFSQTVKLLREETDA